MNILHLYKDYFPVQGGIENHIKLLAEGQVARGHQVSVLITSRGRQTRVETINGVRAIFAARLATISSAPISPAMFTLLRGEQPDIVHLHFPYPWGETANYFVGRTHTVVLTYHSDIIRQKYLRVAYAPLMQRVLARVDAIIATSPNYIATSSTLSRWKEKCVIIPLTIDPAPFETAVPDPPLTSRSSPLLLFVGQLRYYKGLQYLIRALCELPQARLLIVGNGPMESTWRSLANELNIADRVAFVSHVADADLPPYYAACDVFVLPSSERSEAFGLVQLEAMAAGKPVVCTELGTGTSFVNVDGKTGFVVPPRDAHALAVAINRLINDKPLCAQMGAAGRARVEKDFRLEKMVDRILALYENLIFGNN